MINGPHFSDGAIAAVVIESAHCFLLSRSPCVVCAACAVCVLVLSLTHTRVLSNLWRAIDRFDSAKGALICSVFFMSHRQRTLVQPNCRLVNLKECSTFGVPCLVAALGRAGRSKKVASIAVPSLSHNPLSNGRNHCCM